MLQLGRGEIIRRIVLENDGEEMRVSRFLISFGGIPAAAVFKALRKRDIRINRSRIKKDCLVKSGEMVEIYLPEKEERKAVFSVAYEDENILVVNKKQGISVHPSSAFSNEAGSLIEELKKYAAHRFEPHLCHRIDRNTGGLVVAAKNREALTALLLSFEKREIAKFYQCIVFGVPEKEEAVLRHYLSKNEKLSRVFVHKNREKGDLTAITKYRVRQSKNSLSLLEVELRSGRMHQIRAQLAYEGLPILGDGKYGNTRINRKYGVKMQQLWAYKLQFRFPEGHFLHYLENTVVEIPCPLDLLFDRLAEK